MIPIAIKNTLMPLTKIKFHQFAIADFPFYAFFTALLVNIGLSINSINEIFHSKKKFKKMKLAQKISVCSTWVIVLTTFIFMVVIGKKLRNVFLEIDDDDESEIEVAEG